MNLRTRVAIRLKTLRQQRGLTQEQLAERIERSVDALSNLERGLSLPGFETLERLAEALDVPVRDFFDPEDEANGSARRTELLTTLNALARGLSEDDLEIAVRQTEVLANRANGKSSR